MRGVPQVPAENYAASLARVGSLRPFLLTGMQAAFLPKRALGGPEGVVVVREPAQSKLGRRFQKWRRRGRGRAS